MTYVVTTLHIEVVNHTCTHTSPHKPTQWTCRIFLSVWRQAVRDWGLLQKVIVLIEHMKCTSTFGAAHSSFTDASNLLHLHSRRGAQIRGAPITQDRPCLSRRPGLCTAWSRTNAAWIIHAHTHHEKSPEMPMCLPGRKCNLYTAKWLKQIQN